MNLFKVKHILFFVFLGYFSSLFHAQPISFDMEPLQTHYKPIDYNFPATVLDAAEDSLGAKYFATTSGVMVYDGRNWTKIKTNFRVLSLISDSKGNIYLGGNGEIGTLITDEKGYLQYKSLWDEDQQVKMNNSAEEFRSIVEINDNIYFASNKYLFVSNKDQSLKEIPLPFKYTDSKCKIIFNVNEELFCSIHKQGLYVVKEGVFLLRKRINPCLYIQTQLRIGYM